MMHGIYAAIIKQGVEDLPVRPMLTYFEGCHILLFVCTWEFDLI